jgi:hypothetical protein
MSAANSEQLEVSERIPNGDTHGVTVIVEKDERIGFTGGQHAFSPPIFDSVCGLVAQVIALSPPSPRLVVIRDVQNASKDIEVVSWDEKKRELRVKLIGNALGLGGSSASCSNTLRPQLKS